MRCFIAIEVDPDIRAAIADLEDQIKANLGRGRSAIKWVNPNHMHLTLKFLGDVPDAEVVTVCHAAEAVAAEHRPFNLDIQGLGHFGGPNARVLWIGTGPGTEALESLQKGLEDRLHALGWPREGRRFTGHLTLCRIRNAGTGRDLVHAYQPFRDQVLGTTRVENLTVFQSELTRQGPLYTPMGVYGLGSEKGQE